MVGRGAHAGESARDHFERGSTAYALGHFAEAADEYEKAFALKPELALLFDAAQALRLAGNRQRALVLYQNCLVLFGDQVPNANEIKQHLVDLKRAIDAEQAAHPSLVAAQMSAAPPPLPPHDGHRRRWVWGAVAGGVVLAGLVLGVGLGVGLGANRWPAPTFGSLTLQ